MRNRHRGGVIESHSDTIHDKNYTEVSNKKKRSILSSGAPTLILTHNFTQQCDFKLSKSPLWEYTLL